MSQYVELNGERFYIRKATILVDGNAHPYAGPYVPGHKPNSIIVNGEEFLIQDAKIIVDGDGQPLTSL